MVLTAGALAASLHAGAAFLAIAIGLSFAQIKAPSWKLEFPVLSPGLAGTFDETAVKDPSIVYSNRKWHVFYTARGNHQYSLGYVSADRIENLTNARRTKLSALSHGLTTVAAPEVFYFKPQAKWYLIYQTAESNYQPVFSTTQTIGDPSTWSAPLPLVKKDDAGKWIDFWVICDREQAYLFYTREHKDVVVMTTKLQDFPHGFANSRVVYSGVHEAVHVYRDAGRPEKYVMLFEMESRNGSRHFERANANKLSGPWMRINGDFASASQLTGTTAPWTADISHGELIRSGNDQRLEADVKHARFLIQAIPPGDHKGDYPELPWQLSLIRNF